MIPKTCRTCRYWSERCAKAIDGGPMEALCLESHSPYASQYTIGNESCDRWAENTYGAIDDPAHDGENPYGRRAP
jgi:hypothetical protein